MNTGLEGFHTFPRWTSWQLVAWWAGNKLSSSSSGSCSQEAEKWSGTLTDGSRQARCDEETVESEALCLTANLHSSLRLSSGSGIQATEMSSLRRVSGLSLRDGARHSETQKEIKAELLLHIERNQLRCFGKLVRMPPWQVVCALGSPSGEIISVDWPGIISGFPWWGWWKWLRWPTRPASGGKDVCFSTSSCSFPSVLSPLQSIAGPLRAWS